MTIVEKMVLMEYLMGVLLLGVFLAVAPGKGVAVVFRAYLFMGVVAPINRILMDGLVAGMEWDATIVIVVLVGAYACLLYWTCYEEIHGEEGEKK